MKASIKSAAALLERPQLRPAICFMAALLGVAIAAVPVLADADNNERANGVTGGSHLDHWWWNYYPYVRSVDGVPDDANLIGRPDGYQVYYYCLDPAGYYPRVTKCAVAWQSIDPNSLPVEPVPAG